MAGAPPGTAAENIHHVGTDAYVCQEAHVRASIGAHLKMHAHTSHICGFIGDDQQENWNYWTFGTIGTIGNAHMYICLCIILYLQIQNTFVEIYHLQKVIHGATLAQWLLCPGESYLLRAKKRSWVDSYIYLFASLLQSPYRNSQYDSANHWWSQPLNSLMVIIMVASGSGTCLNIPALYHRQHFCSHLQGKPVSPWLPFAFWSERLALYSLTDASSLKKSGCPALGGDRGPHREAQHSICSL